MARHRPSFARLRSRRLPNQSARAARRASSKRRAILERLEHRQLLAVGGPPQWSPIGPDTATVFTLERNPADNSVLLAGTNFGGLYRSGNDGLQWQHVPSPFSTDVVFDIEWDPVIPSTAYVGTLDNGAFKTTDAGTSWQQINNGLGDASVLALAVDPNDNNTVLAATFAGIYRSTDAGASWTLATANLAAGRHLEFDPSQSGVVYAGTSGQGIFRSLDSGQTWSSFSAGIGPRVITDIELDPESAGTIFVSTSTQAFVLPSGAEVWQNLSGDLPQTTINQVIPELGNDGLLAATDEGVFRLENLSDTTWSEWSEIPARLLRTDDTGEVIHLAAPFETLFVSTDGGATFVPSQAGIQNDFIGTITGLTPDAAGNSALLAGTSRGVLLADNTTDFQWTPVFDFGGAIFELVPHPSNPDIAYAGTERAGIWQSTAAGRDWIQISNGLVPDVISSIDHAATSDGTLYVGTNAGVYVSRDEGQSWVTQFANVAAGVTSVAADLDRPEVATYALASGEIYRTFDAGETWQIVWNGLSEDQGIASLVSAGFENLYAITLDGQLYASTNIDSSNVEFFRKASEVDSAILAVAVDPLVRTTAYLGTTDGVYKSVDNGQSWVASSKGIDIPFVFAIAVDSQNPARLYAGSVGAVYRSDDAGSSWTQSTTGLPAGRITDLRIDPTSSSTLYASIEDEGIYRSDDGGDSWSPLISGAPFTGRVPIAVNQTTPSTLYAGTTAEGVFSSTDGGATWNPSSDGMTLFVRGIAINPNDPDVMYAGSLGSGIFKTVDAGQHWSNIGLVDRNIFDVVLDPENPDNLYVGTASGIVRSNDGGQTWLDNQLSVTVIDIITDPADRNILYIAGPNGQLSRSADAGISWQERSAGLPDTDIVAVELDPHSRTLYAAPLRGGVYMSADEGLSWQRTGDAAIGDALVFRISADPTDGDVYVATDQGVYRTVDGGTTWLPSGLSEFARVGNIAVSPGDSSLLYASTSEGVVRSTDGGLSWTELGQKLPFVFAVASDPNAPEVVYASSVAGQVYRSLDGGRFWQRASAGLPQLPILDLAIDSSGGLYAYADRDGVYRSTNGGGNWAKVSGNLFEGVQITGLIVNPNTGHLFATSDVEGVYVSFDQGQNWAEVGLDDRGFLTNIVADPDDPQTYYVGTSVGVARTTTGGGIWTELGQKLALVFSVVSHPAAPEVVYVGGTAGQVYRSLDRGQTWTLANSGLPQLQILDLAISPSGILYAHADRDGVYRSSDGGGSWNKVSGTQFDGVLITSLTVEPNSGTLLATTDVEGVFVSFDEGQSWASVGLSDRGVLSNVAVDPNDPQTYFVGTSVGVARSTTGGGIWTELGQKLALVFSVVSHPAAPEVVYVGGTAGQVYRSLDRGQTWTLANSGLPQLQILDLAISPSGILYAHADRDGVYRSSDGGGSWNKVSGTQFDGVLITSLTVEPNSGTLLATTDVEGVFVSFDEGQSWADVGLDERGFLSNLAVDPNDPQTYYVGTPVGVARSTTGGGIWTELGQKLALVFSVVSDPNAPQVVYASGNAGQVYRSLDAGQTWALANNGLPTLQILSLTVDSDGTLYASPEREGVYKSDDGGLNWQQTDNAVLGDALITKLSVDLPSGHLYAATSGAGLFRSTDGETWEQLTTGFASATVSEVAIDPLQADRLYAATLSDSGSGAGVYVSNDGGTSWQPSASGIGSASIHDLSVSPFTVGELFAVADDGVYHSADGGVSWQLRSTGLESVVPRHVIHDPADPLSVYVGTAGDGMYRSTDGGQSWSALPGEFGDLNVLGLTPADAAGGIHIATTEHGIFRLNAQRDALEGGVDPLLTTPIVDYVAVAPSDSSIMYAALGQGGVARSLDAGVSWRFAREGLQGAQVRSLHVAANDPETVTAATDRGLFRTSDGGQNWTNVAAEFTDLNVLGLATGDGSGQLYIATSQHGLFQFNESGDALVGGVDPALTTPIVDFVAVAPTDSTVLYAALGQGGVARSRDGGATWRFASEGLASAMVRALWISPADPQEISAATDQGLFRSSDGGETWSAIPAEFGTLNVLGFTAADAAGGFYLSTSQHGLFRLNDAGDGLVGGVDPALATPIVDYVAVAPSDSSVLYAALAVGGVARSLDGGGTWRMASDGLAGAIVRSLLVSKTDPLFVTAATNQGLYRSRDGGSTWQALNTPFTDLSGAALAFGASDDEIYAGTIGNGVLWTGDGGEIWDGGLVSGLAQPTIVEVVVAPSDANTLYAITNQFGVIKSADAGSTWQPLPNTGLDGVEVRSLLVSLDSPDVVYAATVNDVIYQTVDGGDNWQPTDSGSFALVPRLAQGPEAGDVFAGTIGRGVIATTDAGASWTTGVDPELAPPPTITALAVNPEMPEIVYAATSGLGVLKTTDGGRSWQRSSNGLDDPILLSLTIDKVDPDILYAGTVGGGVYRTADGGASWSAINDGLFNRTVTGLAIDPTDHGIVYAGTEGGGAFQIVLPNAERLGDLAAYRDGEFGIRDVSIYREDFEVDFSDIFVTGTGQPTTAPDEVISDSRSLRLEGISRTAVDSAVLDLQPFETYIFTADYRIIEPSEELINLTVSAVWDGSETTNTSWGMDQVYRGVNPDAGTLRGIIRLGDVSNPTFVIDSSGGSYILDNIEIFRRETTVQAADPALHPFAFPRLGNYTLTNPEIISIINQRPSDEVTELLSRFDVLTGVSAETTMFQDWVPGMRELNPEQIILAYHSAFLAEDFENTAVEGAANRPGLFNDGLPEAFIIRDSEGNILIPPRFPNLMQLNPTDLAPTADGSTLVDYVSAHLDQWVLQRGLFDGVHFDQAEFTPNVLLSVEEIFQTLPPLDLDGDGVPEPTDVVFEEWLEGYRAYFTRIEDLFGSTYFSFGNAGYINASTDELSKLNGWQSELTKLYPWDENGDWDTSGSGEWYRFLSNYLGAIAAAEQPSIVIVQSTGEGLGTPTGGLTANSLPDRVPELEFRDFQRMRLGLTTTLLGDGFFGYDFIDNTTAPVWFDEFAVVNGIASGSADGKGYLGQPLGGAFELPTTGEVIWSIDFEGELPQGFIMDETIASLTTDPQQVISGAQSLLVQRESLDDPTAFFFSAGANAQLEVGKTYQLSADFRVIDHQPESYEGLVSLGFAPAGDTPTRFTSDTLLHLDVDRPGQTGSLRVTHKIGEADVLALGTIPDAGTVAIDNLALVQTTGGVWRRDFENGIVLVNPSPEPLYVSQADVAGPLSRQNIRRILGAQQIEINNGAPVTDGIWLQSGDGIILLADTVAFGVPEPPRDFGVFAEGPAISLGWLPRQRPVAGYLLRYAEQHGDFTETEIIGSGEFFTTLDRLPPATTFTFEIASFDFVGNLSDFSEPVTASTSGLGTLRPALAAAQDVVLVPGQETTLDLLPETVLNAGQLGVLVNGVPAEITAIPSSPTDPPHVSFRVPDSIVGDRAVVRLTEAGISGPGRNFKVVAELVTPDSVEMESPSGVVRAQFNLSAGGGLSYSLTRDGVPVLDDSPLGLVVDGVNVGEKATAIYIVDARARDRVHDALGVAETAAEEYFEYTLLVERAGQPVDELEIEVRLFDDGLAYRYIVPGFGTQIIDGETSGWTIPEGSRLWYQTDTYLYESLFETALIGEFGADLGPPVTFQLPGGGGYGMITEAGLHRYSGMSLDADVGSRLLEAEFKDEVSWDVLGQSATPWRVTVTAPDLNGLVNSDVIFALNREPKGVQYPSGVNSVWIQPGRVISSSLDDPNSITDFAVQLQFIDYAHQLGVEYVLFGPGWEQAFAVADNPPGLVLSALAGYGRTAGKDVGIWVWKNAAELATTEQIAAFMYETKLAGAVGVEIDIVENESQAIVERLEEILRIAAENDLMIVFQGAGKPTGELREFPNLMSFGGVRGLGNYFEPEPFITAEHNATLPFTRFLAGPGDYTPFDLSGPALTTTTYAHQLATAGLFTSPYTKLADHPDTYLSQSAVLDVLAHMPATWDETLVLPGSEIGALAALARRDGDQWYVFIINGDSANPRELADLDLSFLGSQVYDAVLLSDADRTSFARQDLYAVDATLDLDVSLLAGGGFVAMFTPRDGLSRGFRMGTTTTPFIGIRDQEVYGVLSQHADLVSHTFQEGVPWPEALNSDDYRDYPPDLQFFWETIKNLDEANIPGHDSYIVLNPIAVSYDQLAPYWVGNASLQLPAPWDQYEFNHPDVKTAFTNYVTAAIKFWDPQFLAITTEANILQAYAPERWEAYQDLHRHVYEVISQRFPDVELVTTLQYEHLIGLHQGSNLLSENERFAESAELLQYSDVVAYSTYPYMVLDNQVTPGYFDAALQLARVAGIPAAIDQTGYATQGLQVPGFDVVLPGSEELQLNFLTSLLDLAYDERFEFVVNFTALDYGDLFGPGFIEQTWAYAGLYTEDNQPKPVVSVWDSFLDIPYDGSLVRVNTDSDGDGVSDYADCAPDDPSISRAITYYDDTDKDQFGDPQLSYSLCTLRPPAPLTVWANDPFDQWTGAYPPTIPKGQRMLGLDFLHPQADGDFRLDLVRELGADAAVLPLQWGQIESAPGSYEGPQAALLSGAASAIGNEDLRLSLTLSPIDGESLTVPEDLRSRLADGTLRWNDAEVIDRFTSLLDFVATELGPLQPWSLQIGNDVDEQDPAATNVSFWLDYGEFFFQVSQHAKSLWSNDLSVGLTATLEGLTTRPTQGVLAGINQVADFVSVNYVPHADNYDSIAPQRVPIDIAALVNRYPNKPIHFQSVGYPSAPATYSSTTHQSQFLYAFFDSWDQYFQQIPFVAFARLHDWTADVALSLLPEDVTLKEVSHYASLGLRTADGEAKPAYNSLRNLAFNRGWWRIDLPESRSFHMGFTQAPYDIPGDPFEADLVNDETFRLIQDNADIINFHIDGGVPWLEALNDTFESTELPYSQDVVLALSEFKSRIPDGFEVIVSISPTGVPRSNLNSYWGEGQGLGRGPAPEFLPFPEGPVNDAFERFWPEEFAGARFNSPEVKLAFTNYAKRIIDFMEPDYLLVTIEASEILVENEKQFEDYLELQTHVFAALKSNPRYAETPLVVSVSSTSLMTDEFGVPYKYEQMPAGYRERMIEGLRQLVPLADVIGISHYPHFGKYNAFSINATLFESFFDVLEEVGASQKPIGITESGFSADPYTIFGTPFEGSPEKQDQYFKHLFYELEKAPNPIEFVINWSVRDGDLLQQRTIDNGLDFVFTQFNQYFKDLGIVAGDGSTDRPSYDTWRSVLALPHVPKDGPVAVGGVTEVVIGNNEVNFVLDDGVVANVQIVDASIARVRVNPTGELTDRLSGAISTTALDPGDVEITDTEFLTVLSTAEISVVVLKDQFQVFVFGPDGNLISSDMPGGIQFNPTTGEISNQKYAPPDREYYGLGLRGGQLNRRGDLYRMRNSDLGGYLEDSNPLYSSTPFFYGADDGQFYGLFFDNPAASYFDMDSKNTGVLTFGAKAGELDYYVLAGPGPQDVAQSFGQLTGFAPLPAEWTLGFQQSRYGYSSFDEILSLAETFRELQIPADAIYFDLDWMRDLDFLAWDPINFPDPLANNQRLNELGFRTVNIVDPTIQPDDPLYQQLQAEGLFVTDAQGNTLVNPIFEPWGFVSWLDFSDPATASFYVDALREFMATGVTGIWNDLNEPAQNNMPEAIYDFGGQFRTDLEARNLYALVETALTQQAMLEANPNERPFILSRSGYPGIQNYAATWSGDTLTSFDSLRVSIQTSLHMALSGQVYFGHDIGGFLGSPSPELFTRWLEFASFNPLFRNHALVTTEDSEPWRFGQPYTDLNREIINQRYQLLPYLYTEAEEASRTGESILTPLFFEFPEDPVVYGLDDQFMWGESMLVAPVYEAGATSRDVYLPGPDPWFDWNTGSVYQPGLVTVQAPLGTIPVLVRAGGIIPTGPVRQHVDDPVDPQLTVDVFGPANQSYTLYEDDGLSYDFQSGELLRTEITVTSTANQTDISLTPIAGQMAVPQRDVTLRLHAVSQPPDFVQAGDFLIPPALTLDSLQQLAQGWFYDAAAQQLTVHIDSSTANVSVLFDRYGDPENIPHVYYLDLDGDQQGDADKAFVALSPTPFPGSAVWGADPDDQDQGVVDPFVAKGDRRLAVDFLDTADDGAFRFDLVRELGGEVGSVQLLWAFLEDAPGSYQGAFSEVLDFVSATFPAESLALELTVGPIDGPFASLPADLASRYQQGELRLNDPELIERFETLLTHLHAELGETELVSLKLGSQIDQFFAAVDDPQTEQDFIEFVQAASAAAKALWGSELQVGVTSTAAGLISGPSQPFLQSLHAELDVVGVSLRPILVNGIPQSPELLDPFLDALVAIYPDQPIHLVDVAFPSAAEFGSSPTKQTQFIHALFDAWDEHADSIPLVSWARLHDAPDGGDETGAEGASGLRSYTAGGAAKSAYHTLREQTINRGWWQVPQAESRNFFLGVTSHPYDLEPGGPLQGDVMDALFEIVNSSGDLVKLHFDEGVPWTEALNDTFASSELPYSDHLKQIWEAHRSRIQPGLGSVVALNPLGTPRQGPASYWGFGEGFYVDANGDQVPTGVIQDYTGRLEPAPFAGLPLNAPERKTAFLNYARRAVEYFEPQYLVLGLEVNEALDAGPELFDQYVDLLASVSSGLRADPAYADVQLLVSFSVEFLMADELGVPLTVSGIQQSDLAATHRAALEQLLPHIDVLGLSVYPHKSRFGTHQLPATALQRVFTQIREITDMPLAVTETGYPAESFELSNLSMPSDAERQARHLRVLFDAAAKDGNFEFIVNFGSRDFTPRMDQLRQSSLEDPPFISPEFVEFLQLFEFNGLYDADGSERAGTVVWQDQFDIPVQRAAAWVPVEALSSPNGQLTAEVGLDAEGRLFYQVLRGEQVILENARLGLTIDDIDLGSGVTNLIWSSPLEVNASYDLVGRNGPIQNHYIEQALQLRRVGAGDLQWTIEFRMYDDGFAYRYIIPGDGVRQVTGETNVWGFPEQSEVWFQNNTANFESTILNLDLTLFSEDAGAPVTVRVPQDGGYVLLSEAALYDYSGMSLRSELGSYEIASSFLHDASWPALAGASSPWRVAILAADLNQLYNSNLMTSLSPPPSATLFPAGAETAWIEPGRAVWSWWSDEDSSGDFATQQQYVDYADQLGFEYVVVDIHWERDFPSGDQDQFERLAELAQYAQADGRDVGLFVWKQYAELLAVADYDPAWFQTVAAAGARGVKIDAIFGDDLESFDNVRAVEGMLRNAAESELMVILHGIPKPHGNNRTYPHEVTREALMGLELNGLLWDEGTFVPPDHNASLPFTRFVIGPADYTPVTFDARKIGDTTFAHQLATAGLFTSPVQAYADDPANYLAQPDALDVLQAIPTVWDETIVLDISEIGVTAAMARRSGDDWYLFVINGDAQIGRTYGSLDLSWLGDGAYDATFIGDETRTSFDRQEFPNIDSRFNLNVSMLPGGGFTGVFRRVGSALHNFDLPADVSRNGSVTAQDALIIINLLRNGGVMPADRDYLPDVNNDGQVTALDALQVINALARNQAQAGGEGELWWEPEAGDRGIDGETAWRFPIAEGQTVPPPTDPGGHALAAAVTEPGEMNEEAPRSEKVPGRRANPFADGDFLSELETFAGQPLLQRVDEALDGWLL